MRDIRKVLNDNPDLPVIVLGAQYGYDEWDSCYMDDISAETEWLLWPREAKLPGLNDEKIYNDEDDATEDVAEGLYFDWECEAMKHGMRYGGNLEEFCCPGLADMADSLARAMVDAAPWKQYVVIEASA